MKKTRMRLVLDYPFFGNLALTLKLIQDPTCKTFSTNGKWIKYNPDFVAELTPAERMFVYQHEICHVILGHHFRRQGRNYELWGVAADYAVNAMLQKMLKTKTPMGGLYKSKYENMSAEKIYADLKKEFEEQIQQMISDAGQDQPPDADQGGTTPEPPWDHQGGTTPGPPWDHQDSKPGNNQGQSDSKIDQTKQEIDQKQSTSDHKMQTLEEMINKSQQCGTVEDAPEDLSEIEVKAQVVAAHRTTEKYAGHGSQEIIRNIVDEITSNKIPWQDLLANFLTESCNSRYDWMRPNHRYSFGDVIMPSLRARDAINMVIVFDTSGSVNDDEIKEFLAEVQTLINSIDYEKIHCISCDTKIHNPKEFFQHEQLDYKAVGGGGSHTKPVWEWIANEGLTPACVIYFTDLEIFSGFWGDDPGYPVLWIGRFFRPSKPVPFGEKVLIKDRRF
jgi:predicted metal-dependent peptidase